MVLSTDWFFSYWSEIGLNLGTSNRARVQAGCREIVKTVIVRTSVEDEGGFDYIDWRPECELKAMSALTDLMERIDAKGAASAAIENWTSRNDDGLTAAVMLSLFTHELIEGVGVEGSPVPDVPIRAAVMEATVTYDLDPQQFEEISTTSASHWDKYVRGLLDLDEMPTALPDNLNPAIQVHRLRLLWHRVSERLTVGQRQGLLSWYRAVGKSRGIASDPIPGFVAGI